MSVYTIPMTVLAGFNSESIGGFVASVLVIILCLMRFKTPLVIFIDKIVINLGYSSLRQINVSKNTDDLPDLPDLPGNVQMIDQRLLDSYWHQHVDRIATENGLTSRERELFEYMSRGYGSAFIAKSLFISRNTARTHIRNIYKKLEVNSREELLIMLGNKPTQ